MLKKGSRGPAGAQEQASFAMALSNNPPHDGVQKSEDLHGAALTQEPSKGEKRESFCRMQVRHYIGRLGQLLIPDKQIGSHDPKLFDF